MSGIGTIILVATEILKMIQITNQRKKCLYCYSPSVYFCKFELSLSPVFLSDKKNNWGKRTLYGNAC